VARRVETIGRLWQGWRCVTMSVLALYARLVLSLSTRGSGVSAFIQIGHVLLPFRARPSHNAPSFEKQCTCSKRQPWYSPDGRNWVYKPDTIRNLQRRSRDNKALEPATKQTDTAHTISPAQRFCCYPPKLYTRPPFPALCSPVRLGLHPPTHTPTHSSLLVGRSIAPIHPLSTIPVSQETAGPLFLIYSRLSGHPTSVHANV
jgi:hypothetical protein